MKFRIYRFPFFLIQWRGGLWRSRRDGCWFGLGWLGGCLSLGLCGCGGRSTGRGRRRFLDHRVLIAKDSLPEAHSLIPLGRHTIVLLLAAFRKDCTENLSRPSIKASASRERSSAAIPRDRGLDPDTPNIGENSTPNNSESDRVLGVILQIKWREILHDIWRRSWPVKLQDVLEVGP